MRAAALLALAGCNQIFGLNDPVGLVDGAGPPADAPFPSVRLTHLVAQTRTVNMKAVPDPVLQRPPLDAPAVKIGPLAGPLVDADYDATTGQVRIPPEVFDSTDTWRLQYRLDGVPRDVYWTTPRDNGEPKLVVPTFGRLPRTGPPADSGYDIRPAGVTPPPPSLGNYRASRVFTTGVFMDIFTGTSPHVTRLDTIANKHISGPIGTPDAMFGDSGTLANYVALPGCEHLVDGYADFFVPPPIAGTRQIPLAGGFQPGQPTWSNNQSVLVQATVSRINAGTFGPGVRLGDALDDRSDGALDPDLFQIGFGASDLIPLLTPERPLSFLKSGVSTDRHPPGPLMFLLAQCTLATTTSGGFVEPQGLGAYPRVAYGVTTNRRPVNGIELLSSVVTVNLPITGTAFELDFGVPLPITPITLFDGAGTFDLSGTTDGIAVSPAATFELDFTLEADAGGFVSQIDYVEVTVFRVNATLIPVHVYVTANVARDVDGTLVTPVRIDGSDLAGGGDYVFQIRTVRGTPNASRGDFESIAFPQAMATVFTRTITVQ